MKTRYQRLHETIIGLSLSAPAVVLMILFIIGPALFVIMLSFSDYQLGANALRFVGLKNYVEMAADPVFRLSIRNTFTYVAIVVPGSVLLGLFLALLIESETSGRAFYRAAYFLPIMATTVAMTVVWEFMLHPNFGMLNLLLAKFGIKGPYWLQDRKIVLYTLCGIGIWQSLGFSMVLFSAGLKSIPSELFEAGEIDGADLWWDRFCLVTWPMLGPVTLFVLIVSAIRSFQVFDIVQVLTAGGPNHASEVLLVTMYAEGFQYFRSGYAAAVTTIFLGVVLLLALVKFWLLERRVHYA
jgi:multiple sugar transport system permease protein